MLAVAATVLIVLLASEIRERIDPVATGFGFLVLVVACVGLGGLGPGIVASVLGFIAFDFYFLPPYETFRSLETCVKMTASTSLKSPART